MIPSDVLVEVVVLVSALVSLGIVACSAVGFLLATIVADWINSRHFNASEDDE